MSLYKSPRKAQACDTYHCLSQQGAEPSSGTDTTATDKKSIMKSRLKVEVDSKATAASYTTANTTDTAKAVLKSELKLKDVLQSDAIVGTDDTAVKDTANTLSVKQDVVGVKDTSDVAIVGHDASATNDTSAVTAGKDSAKQSSVVAAAAVGAAGANSGRRKAMRLSLTLPVAPADTNNTGDNATGE